MGYRVAEDGTLFLPRRGKPKGCPDGFQVDPKDKFKCLPILCECSQREVVIKKSSCCPGGNPFLQCNAIDSLVTAGMCHECKGKVEWISDYRKKYGLREKGRPLILEANRHEVKPESS